MDDYFGCNNCSRAFCFMVKKTKLSEDEKAVMLEENMEYMLRKPFNKSERETAVWYITRDLEHYNPVDDEEIETIKEIGCKNCKHFLNNVIIPQMQDKTRTAKEEHK